MNRYSYIKGYKKPKIVDPTAKLTPESFWLCRDHSDGFYKGHVKRIVRLERTENNKHIYKIQSCRQPKWYSKNKWNDSTWAVDDVYLRYDFNKQYKKINFFNITNLKFWYGLFVIHAETCFMANIYNHKWWMALLMVACMASNFFWYRRWKW